MHPSATLVLMPGMDGTGLLFGALEAALPAHLTPLRIAYDVDEPKGYDALLDEVRARLPQDGPFVLVGESFSGPLALRIAAEQPPGLVGVVLVATFIVPPVLGRRFWSALAHESLFRVSPPRFGVRAVLTGFDAPDHLVDEVRTAVEAVYPYVLARRAKEILSVDAAADLRRVKVPVHYIGAIKDRVVGADARNAVAEVRHDVTFTLLDGPHLVLQRRPFEAADAIATFVDGLMRAEPPARE